MREETGMFQESHGMVEMGGERGKGRRERRREKVGWGEQEGGRDCVVSPAPQ